MGRRYFPGQSSKSLLLKSHVLLSVCIENNSGKGNFPAVAVCDPGREHRSGNKRAGLFFHVQYTDDQAIRFRNILEFFFQFFIPAV